MVRQRTTVRGSKRTGRERERGRENLEGREGGRRGGERENVHDTQRNLKQIS